MKKYKIQSLLWIFLFVCLLSFKSSAATVTTRLELVTNGGTCDKSYILLVYDDASNPLVGVLPSCTKEGYTFLGWKDAEGKVISKNSYVKNIVGSKLYAYYTEAAKTITLNPNGGNCSKKTISVIYGGQFGNLPIPTRSGYTFLGWFTQAEGGVQITSDTINTYKTNITLYAHWQQNKKETKKGKITLSWKKVSGATGYQIKYSTSKKFKKNNTKTVTIKKTKKTFKNLKYKKKYYFKIRAYKKSGKKKIYSAWSKAISKKAK